MRAFTIMALWGKVTMPLTTTHGPQTSSTTEVSHSLSVWRRNVIPVITANASNTCSSGAEPCSHSYSPSLHHWFCLLRIVQELIATLGPHVVLPHAVWCTAALLHHLLWTCMDFNAKLTPSIHFSRLLSHTCHSLRKEAQRQTLDGEVTLRCLPIIHS